MRGNYNFNGNDFDPQEIFREFFGASFGNDANVRTFHFGGNGFNTFQRKHRGESNPDTRYSLLQLLPLLLLIFMSFGSFPSRQEVPFSLHKTTTFRIKRMTSTRGITPEIPFFVDSNFKSTYGRDHRKLHEVEGKVESLYTSMIDNQCRSDRISFDHSVKNARRNRNNKALEWLLSQPDSSACKELARLQSRKPS